MAIGFVLGGGGLRTRGGRGCDRIVRQRNAFAKWRMESPSENRDSPSANFEKTPSGDSVKLEPLVDPAIEELSNVAAHSSLSTVADPDMTANEEHPHETGENAFNDLLYCLAVFALVPITYGVLLSDQLETNGQIVSIAIFLLGYGAIVFEDILKLNKSAVSLIMASFMWTMVTASSTVEKTLPALTEKLGDVSEILFFLLGAMTIVEIVDSHEGFKIVTNFIRTTSRRQLLWIIGFVTFFMSSVLDNLTSTIVMVSLLRKLVDDPEERKLYGGVVVIAANAGGAWTPIGDVTTTMLWINGNISGLTTMTDLFLPSMISMLVSLAVVTPTLSGDVKRSQTSEPAVEDPGMDSKRQIVFWGGLGALVGVPIFKAATGLPPFMGMVCGLGTLWVITDYINRGDDQNSDYRRAESALQRIDTSSVLFFLGILLSVAALEHQGLLRALALNLDNVLPNLDLVAIAIGLFSAIIDNVPLVAASMGMYDAAQFPMDSKLWQLIAYCAGTGGSIFVIGSAAGVALMGMEKTDFFWYLRKMSFPALAGAL
mmetsp:Transcript_30019/g.115235  ORF Transcript_30019/g.115235 Transcript_30019/m.115235 type:complete len:542 (-) Transcript_30019:1110-2735(-)